MIVNGARIKEDRELKRLSRQALCDKIEELGFPRISEKTLQRAEVNNNATEATLRYISRALQTNIRDYIQRGSPFGQVVHDISGDWVALHKERQTTSAPYIAEEELFIRQSGDVLEGIYEPTRIELEGAPLRPSNYRMDGRLREDYVFGTYYSLHDVYNTGCGSFQLKVLRESDWASGYCTYTDDSTLVCVSQHFWVRKSAFDFEGLLDASREHLRRDRNFDFAPLVLTPDPLHERPSPSSTTR